MPDMKRREFITLIGAAGVLWPAEGRAQPHPKIGLLDTGLGAAFTVPFIGKLADLGYMDGKNVIIEQRSAEGKAERLDDLVADLVRKQVSVIVTAGTPAALRPRRRRAQSPLFWEPLATPLVSVWSRALPGPAGT
jgi:putative ABC transport system substrate-binding protein